jgi:uncharacterized protein YdhG (YjbR/CyaY superfamily)
MARMKKGKSLHRSSSAKRSRPPRTVNEYLTRVPEPARSALRKLHAAIRSAVPREATEVISYKIPALKYQNKILLWFAAFSDHCSLFPTASVIAAFHNELKGYSTSKGTIHFPIGKPLPISLIKKIVKARVAQIQT